MTWIFLLWTFDQETQFSTFWVTLLWTPMLKVQLHRTPANHLLLHLLFISYLQVVVFATGVWTHFFYSLFYYVVVAYFWQKIKILPTLLFIFKWPRIDSQTKEICVSIAHFLSPGSCIHFSLNSTGPFRALCKISLHYSY